MKFPSVPIETPPLQDLPTIVVTTPAPVASSPMPALHSVTVNPYSQHLSLGPSMLHPHSLITLSSNPVGQIPATTPAVSPSRLPQSVPPISHPHSHPAPSLPTDKSNRPIFVVAFPRPVASPVLGASSAKPSTIPTVIASSNAPSTHHVIFFTFPPLTRLTLHPTANKHTFTPSRNYSEPSQVPSFEGVEGFFTPPPQPAETVPPTGAIGQGSIPSQAPSFQSVIELFTSPPLPQETMYPTHDVGHGLTFSPTRGGSDPPSFVPSATPSAPLHQPPAYPPQQPPQQPTAFVTSDEPSRIPSSIPSHHHNLLSSAPPTHQPASAGGKPSTSPLTTNEDAVR